MQIKYLPVDNIMLNNDDDLDAIFDRISIDSSKNASESLGAIQLPPQASIFEAPPAALEIDSRQDGNRDEDADLYGRLGGIVRTLHDSLRELGLDRSLSEAADSINDAKDRLAYIATLTEEAATKVLNTLDAAIPAQTNLALKAREISGRWDLMLAGKLEVSEFKELVKASREFSDTVAMESEMEKARLIEIMMAQDFQDLTGQIIKKVIGVTKSVEHDLAQLLKDHAPTGLKDKLHKEVTVDLMSGPDTPENSMVQDDVDDILAELGF